MSNDTFSPEDLFSQFATGGFQEPAAAQAPTFQDQGASGSSSGGTVARTGSGEGDGGQTPAGAAPNSELAELRAMIAKQNETITALQAQSLGGAPTFQDQHQQGFGQQQQQRQQQQQQQIPTQHDPEAVKQAWMAKFYEDPFTAVDQIANARAQQMVNQYVEPLRSESTSSSIESFLAEQRSSDGIYESVEPQFRKMLSDKTVQQTLARMPPAQRRSAFNDIYNAATGVAYRDNLKTAMKNGKIDFRPAPTYNAGYSPRSTPASQNSRGYDTATQSAYDRLIASGMDPAEAADALKDGE